MYASNSINQCNINIKTSAELKKDSISLLI